MENQKKTRKRFWFSIIAIICGSIVACKLHFLPYQYLDLVKWISIVFVAGQSITDMVGKK